jgi:ribose transport system permease protein
MAKESATQTSAAEPEAASPPAPPARPGGPRRSRGEIVGSLLAKYGLLLAFVVTILIFSLARPDSFATMQNVRSILTLAAPALIIASGLTVVLVMQDFDLSFAGMIGLAAGAVTVLMVNENWPWGVAVVVVLLMGIAAGVLNGIFVAGFGGASFIITLAMGTILTGVEFGFTNQETVFAGMDPSFTNVASSEILGLNTQIWIAAGIAILIWLLLDRTEVGRYMNAIGGNAEAARLSGVRVRQLRIAGFVIVGLTAAIVGLLIASRAASYSPNPGITFLLPAFAAVFLGSAVFRPGSFNVPGTVVGVLFLGTIQTGLTMLDFETYIINLVQGTILITAVLISRLGQRAGG